MLPLNPAGAPVSDAAILDALTYATGTRELTFRFERVSPSGAVLGDLSRFVVSCSVENNSLADVKRTAKIVLDAAAPVDLLADRIRPWARLEVDGELVEWPLGLFLLATPTTPLGAGGVIEREIDAYDQLLALRDRKTRGRYTVPAGGSYTDAVSYLVTLESSIETAITPSPRTLPAARDWEPGTSFLAVINDLLGAINYKSATFDAYGRFVAEPYRAPADRDPEFAYATDARSVIGGAPATELDLFEIPNEFFFYVSEPDRPTISTIYANENPGSPTSIPSRGRRITEVTKSEAPDLETLRAQARRRAAEASQVFEAIEFETAPMPMHADADVYTVEIEGLVEPATYAEQTWSFDLKAGASMKHRARRTVQV